MTKEKQLHYCYVLRCRDGSLYTGYTTDVERRVWEHNNSDKCAKYTKSRRPCTLVHSEAFDSKSEAMKREAEIKRLTKPQKEKLIASGSR